MTHTSIITYRCECQHVYEDDGSQPTCPKCMSERRRQLHAETEDDCDGRERY